MQFKEFLWDKFSSYYSKEDNYKDNQGEGLFQRFLSVFGLELDNETIPALENFVNQLDPTTAADKFLTEIAYQVGSPSDLLNNTEAYRNLLVQIISIYQAKGTFRSYELLFGLFGFKLEGEELFLSDNKYDTGLKFDTGVIYDDDPCSHLCTSYNLYYQYIAGIEPTFFDLDAMKSFITEMVEPSSARLNILRLDNSDVSGYLSTLNKAYGDAVSVNINFQSTYSYKLPAPIVNGFDYGNIPYFNKTFNQIPGGLNFGGRNQVGSKLKFKIFSLGPPDQPNLYRSYITFYVAIQDENYNISSYLYNETREIVDSTSQVLEFEFIIQRDIKYLVYAYGYALNNDTPPEPVVATIKNLSPNESLTLRVYDNANNFVRFYPLEISNNKQYITSSGLGIDQNSYRVALSYQGDNQGIIDLMKTMAYRRNGGPYLRLFYENPSTDYHTMTIQFGGTDSKHYPDLDGNINADVLNSGDLIEFNYN